MSDTVIDLNDLKRRMDGALASLKHDLSGLRTGRASASVLDPVMVKAYGQDMPINQLGTINVPEPRMISVQVWDKSVVGAVERAIRDANLGLNPIADGTNLRIPLPELNEERRKELVKVAHQYAESCQGRGPPRASRRHGAFEKGRKRRSGRQGRCACPAR